MSDAPIERDFYQRDPEEQQAFLDNTWCNDCQELDLGMTEPREYELNGRIYIEGRCVKCGATVRTEIADENEDV
ncbi:hypothetical protein [Saccharospirillum mangrovi]|uniref:hypothetical protein n=1 Tax=Saccharospirillum mangrovi TaxID=2161747 RepID=UPI000D347979|nr:hypothetical protein [Saccharospirillum mangrovi]